MGLGVFKNGRHQPITSWSGSWAQQEAERRAKGVPRPAALRPTPAPARKTQAVPK